MQIPSDEPYRFSEHARARLAERAALSERDLLDLLRQGAFRRIRSTIWASIPKGDIDFFTAEYGLSFQEMKRWGMVHTKEVFRHLLVWSCADQRPLTLVVTVDDKTIVTVLYADDFSKHDWSDIVTPDKISHAKEMAERLRDRPLVAYELHARWLDADGIPKRKTFSSPKIVSVSPLSPPLKELEALIRSHAGACRDIQLVVRNKKDHSIVALEKSLDSME